MNIKEVLVKQSSRFPEKPAIIFEGKNITYSDLKKAAFKLANYLVKTGIGKDDKVAVYLSNIPETVFSLFGVLSTGGCVVPLDFMLTQEEIINFVNHSEAKVLITQPKKDVELDIIKKQCPSLKEIIVYKEEIEPFSYWDRIMAESTDREPDAEIDEDSLSSIFYTSGSTGHPKGVMLTFRHFDNPVKVIDGYLNVSDKDSYLCGGVPFSHVGGLDYALFMLYFGSTLILMERFHPLEFLKNLEQYKATIFCIVPAMFVAILSMKAYDQFVFESLRYAVVFGAPSSPMLLKKFYKAYPNAQLRNGWGMTETAAPNSYSPQDINKLNSIGDLSFDIESKVVDDEGNALGDQEQGELCLKGDAVMRGYYKEEELTREVLTQDGWLRTGDIVRRDEDGLYYIVGRKKEMIKVAGEIVFAPEVEEVIQRNPKVAEVAVIGVGDKLRGEVPKAFIVAKEGQALDKEELRDFLKPHLAHFKMPHYFEFVDKLPKNRTGKVDKQLLKATA